MKPGGASLRVSARGVAETTPLARCAANAPTSAVALANSSLAICNACSASCASLVASSRASLALAARSAAAFSALMHLASRCSTAAMRCEGVLQPSSCSNVESSCCCTAAVYPSRPPARRFCRLGSKELAHTRSALRSLICERRALTLLSAVSISTSSTTTVSASPCLAAGAGLASCCCRSLTCASNCRSLSVVDIA